MVMMRTTHSRMVDMPFPVLLFQRTLLRIKFFCCCLVHSDSPFAVQKKNQPYGKRIGMTTGEGKACAFGAGERQAEKAESSKLKAQSKRKI